MIHKPYKTAPACDDLLYESVKLHSSFIQTHIYKVITRVIRPRVSPIVSCALVFTLLDFILVQL